MREQVVEIVQRYLDAVRRNDASALPLHPDVIAEFPTSIYHGAAAFREALEPFARIVKGIEVVRLIVDGEHCVAILQLDTVFGPVPIAEYLHVSNGQIVAIRGYYDPRSILSGAGEHGPAA